MREWFHRVMTLVVYARAYCGHTRAKQFKVFVAAVLATARPALGSPQFPCSTTQHFFTCSRKRYNLSISYCRVLLLLCRGAPLRKPRHAFPHEVVVVQLNVALSPRDAFLEGLRLRRGASLGRVHCVLIQCKHGASAAMIVWVR